MLFVYKLKKIYIKKYIKVYLLKTIKLNILKTKYHDLDLLLNILETLKLQFV